MQHVNIQPMPALEQVYYVDNDGNLVPCGTTVSHYTLPADSAQQGATVPPMYYNLTASDKTYAVLQPTSSSEPTSAHTSVTYVPPKVGNLPPACVDKLCSCPHAASSVTYTASEHWACTSCGKPTSNLSPAKVSSALCSDLMACFILIDNI